MAHRPQGRVAHNDLALVEEQLPDTPDGTILVRNIYISIDPTNRLWMSDVDQFEPSIATDAPIRALTFGEVIVSRNAKFKPGDLVTGQGAWETHSVMTHARVLPTDDSFDLTAHASGLGMPGLSAYFGFLEEGEPTPGETVTVSAAAGAVGSIVGQIAKIKGCRTVGIAGGPAKCQRLLDRYGYDAAIDYKASDWEAAFAEACPNGIDVAFENVGGAILDAALTHINDRSRIVLCGLIASYNADGDWEGVKMLRNVLLKRARLQGFLIATYWQRLPEGMAQLRRWALDGKLKWDVDVLDGIENAPAALDRVFEGHSTGKQLVRVAPDPTAGMAGANQ